MSFRKAVLGFLSLIYLIKVEAQSEYNPEFLIPFNDHGKWGWCDTLGKILITPEYKSAHFFSKTNGLYVSGVSTAEGNFTYIHGKGKLPLRGFGLYGIQKEELLKQEIYIVQNKEYKTGIFDWNKNRLLVDTTCSNIQLNHGDFIVFQKKEDKFIYVFDIKKKKAVKSPFNETIYDYESDKSYFRNENSKWHELNGEGKFIESTLQRISESFFVVEDPFLLSPVDFTYNSIDIAELKLDPSIAVYSNIMFARQLIYVVFFKDGKYGIMDKNQKVVLNNEYDFISIDFQDGFFYLLKDGKLGVKILSTNYPTISPNYEFIKVNRQLRINTRWSFTLFEIIQNGQKGFVGENGVEYFDFK